MFCALGESFGDPPHAPSYPFLCPDESSYRKLIPGPQNTSFYSHSSPAPLHRPKAPTPHPRSLGVASLCFVLVFSLPRFFFFPLVGGVEQLAKM